jgi:threonine aldolase
MTKYSFKNDYSEGAHPRILEAFSKSNLDQQAGYGYDIYSAQVADSIKKLIQNDTAAVFFVSGGTQANLVAISAMLQPYESIIATDIGHIATHETGAIEAIGHKVNTVAHVNGKISVEAIKEVIE